VTGGVGVVSEQALNTRKTMIAPNNQWENLAFIGFSPGIIGAALFRQNETQQCLQCPDEERFRFVPKTHPVSPEAVEKD
jgi:hypothetical protein